MSTEPIFLAPLRLEALALRLGAPHSCIERIGMGPIRSAQACRSISARIAPERPIVLAGVAGALVDGLHPGDVVVANSLSAMNGAKPVMLTGACDLATELEHYGHVVHVGPILSSSSIVRGDAARADAAARGAVAVDMESLWCAPLALAHPFYVVRVILDLPGHDVVSWGMPRASLIAFRALARVARVLTNSTIALAHNVPLTEVGEG